MSRARTPTIETLIIQALAHIQAGAWPQAQATCQQALQLDPRHPEAHHLAGHVAGQLGDREQGLRLLEQAVALAPAHPQYRYNLAVSLVEAGRENEAALQYRACLRQAPDHRDALWNYGEMLRLAEHFDLAAQLLERCQALGDARPALHHRLAVSFSALGRDDACAVQFEREISRPDCEMLTHWEQALHLLSRERFEQGFAQYRKRFQCHGRNSVYCHDFGLPLWGGQFQSGQTLLVHGEQGLGDEMMFASIVPELLADAAAAGARVVLAVKPPLVRIFAQSFPQATVLAHKVGAAPAKLSGLGAIDVQLPMGDLPHFYRHTEADFDRGAQPYLRADPARAHWYRQQLQALEPAGSAQPQLRVGLMWGSNPAPVNAKFTRWSQQRSIPVAQFEGLAHHLPQVRFVSLQNRERGAEAALAPHLDIFDLSALQTDFAETAALIEALDLVISVDTSVSHLAGAMAKPCWVPLMQRADWRHGLTREHSLWYPGTRYFRQTQANHWDDVLARIDGALQQRCAAAS
jgi:Flp pilus assembly protein TadD